jgi:hypothetical protein
VIDQKSYKKTKKNPYLRFNEIHHWVGYVFLPMILLLALFFQLFKSLQDIFLLLHRWPSFFKCLVDFFIALRFANGMLMDRKVTGPSYRCCVFALPLFLLRFCLFLLSFEKRPLLDLLPFWMCYVVGRLA